MAELVCVEDGVRVPLVAQHLVGRSRSCQLHIDREGVSGVHAEFLWSEREWRLHDLASTNGTFLGGRRLEKGEKVPLAVQIDISFGGHAPVYRLVDASPPRLLAFGPTGAVVGDDETLYLPSRADPDLMIMLDTDDRWVIETDKGPKPINDGARIVVRDESYIVHLPRSVPLTHDLVAPPPHDCAALDDVELELLVSRCGEHIEGRLLHAGTVRVIESRAHSQLVLELARARCADAKDGRLPEREHGWLYRENLMTAINGADAQSISNWILRTRQQFGELSIPQLRKRIIESRVGTGQVRLGLPRVSVCYA